VVVVGTGALACLFGARLQRFAGARVTLTGVWTEALAAIAAQGVRVEDDSGAWSARLEVASRTSSLGQADRILVLVKGYQTAEVAPVVARTLAPEGRVLTLQNGLGHREAFEAAVGTGRVSAGVVTLGATLLGPGHVRATPGEVVLGNGAATHSEGPLFQELLTDAGFDVRVEPDLEATVWRKLAVNCALNPSSALAGCTNGGLLQSPELRGTVVAAAREVGAVAAARGLDLGADPAELALAVAETTAANRSSMLQDVARGTPTEIDCLNGAVVDIAHRLGIPVPVNENLVRRIRALPRRATA